MSIKYTRNESCNMHGNSHYFRLVDVIQTSFEDCSSASVTHGLLTPTALAPADGTDTIKLRCHNCSCDRIDERSLLDFAWELRSIPSDFPRSISWRLTGPVTQFVQRTSVSVFIIHVLYIECTYNSEAPRPQDIRWRTSYSDLLLNMKSHYGQLPRESLSTL